MKAFFTLRRSTNQRIRSMLALVAVLCVFYFINTLGTPTVTQVSPRRLILQQQEEPYIPYKIAEQANNSNTVEPAVADKATTDVGRPLANKTEADSVEVLPVVERFVADTVFNDTESGGNAHDPPVPEPPKNEASNGDSVPIIEKMEFVNKYTLEEAELALILEKITKERELQPNRKSIVYEKNVEQCPDKPSSLLGWFKPTLKPPSPEEFSLLINTVNLDLGGHYKPPDCEPVEKVAVIIPYRDRYNHLLTLLPNLIPMLIRQKREFTIFVIEQGVSAVFNKGVLFNAGFLEVMKEDSFDCIYLQDVDTIPVDDRNIYRCNKTSPLHVGAAMNKWNYKIGYPGIFGGVVAFTPEQFRTINGASNLYFGWGAEDDDLRDRFLFKKFSIYRKPVQYAKYDMITHTQETSGWRRNPGRMYLMKSRKARQDIDGLNTVRYFVPRKKKYPLYTLISVTFDRKSTEL